ncbi:MAG: type IX secretion system protein PorQ [Muribaculaceae bacterium]|nr:type IX secretion system protein PorQ [Muribaculaceae bacterium]
MIYRILMILLLAFVGLVPVNADDDTEAYQFLNTTSSVRIYGLGGINISTVEDNLEVADQNPALLGPEMGGWIDLNYMRYVGDSNFAGVKYGQALGNHGAWLAGIQYFGYGSIQETDVTGEVIGDFSPLDISFSGTFSYDLFSRWRIGATVKFLYSSYADYTAWAVATDLGLNYYNPNNDLSISVVGANLGGQIKKFEEINEKLPVDLRIGFTKGLGHLPIRLSVTAWNLLKWKDNYKGFMKHIVLGFDFVPSSKFYLSLGYNYKVRSDMSSYHRNLLSGFSVGAGLSTSRFNIGLALAQPHTGATTFMINFGLKLYDLIH